VRSDKQVPERKGLEMFVTLPDALIIAAVFGLVVILAHVGIWAFTDGQHDPEEQLENE